MWSHVFRCLEIEFKEKGFFFFFLGGGGGGGGGGVGCGGNSFMDAFSLYHVCVVRISDLCGSY